jgi:predicted glutamine amidotransferase
MRAQRGELPDDLYAALTGPSDAETLFLLAIAELRRGASLGEALAHIGAAVVRRVGEAEAQLNMLLADGERLAAMRASNGLVTNSLYVASRPPFAPAGVVLASQPPEPGAVWEAVDGQSLVEVDAEGRIRTDRVFFR